MPSQKDKEGETPIDFAQEIGNKKIIQLLKEKVK